MFKYVIIGKVDEVFRYKFEWLGKIILSIVFNLEMLYKVEIYYVK